MNAAEIVEIRREKAIKHPIGRWADDVRIEKSVLSEAADLIEQLEDDLKGAHDETHRLMKSLSAARGQLARIAGEQYREYLKESEK